VDSTNGGQMFIGGSCVHKCLWADFVSWQITKPKTRKANTTTQRSPVESAQSYVLSCGRARRPPRSLRLLGTPPPPPPHPHPLSPPPPPPPLLLLRLHIGTRSKNITCSCRLCILHRSYMTSPPAKNAWRTHLSSHGSDLLSRMKANF
jgi:hypothetical protein